MIKKVNDGSMYYENFTLYPMYEQRCNEDPIFQMLKVSSNSMDCKTRMLDLFCFPDLYPYGNNGQHADRLIKITSSEYIKARLLSKNRTFRLNLQYLFYLLNDSNMRQLNSGIYHTMNVNITNKKYTAGKYLNDLNNKDETLNLNLKNVFAKLRNTSEYWKKPKRDVKCMIENYGPATWFITISPAEWMWFDLRDYLITVNPSMKNNTISEMIALDPIATSRFFDNKFKAFLDFIKSPDNTIGEVEHYFWRREYQSRGMPHMHLLVWIKNAPILGISSPEEIGEFILKYCSCKLPDKRKSPELHKRILNHQTHKHNSYCLRTKKTSKESMQIYVPSSCHKTFDIERRYNSCNWK